MFHSVLPLAIFFVQSFKDAIGDGFKCGEVFRRAECDFLKLVGELPCGFPRRRVTANERKRLSHDEELPRVALSRMQTRGLQCIPRADRDTMLFCQESYGRARDFTTFAGSARRPSAFTLAPAS